MILRSLSVVPGSATARVQAAALVLLLSFTKFGLYVRTGQAAGWTLENCQSHVFGKQLACCCAVSSLQSPVSTLPLLPPPFPPPIQTDSPDVCCPSTTPWAWAWLCTLIYLISATASSLHSRSFQTFRVYVMNVILPGPGIPFILQNVLYWNLTVWFLDCLITPQHYRITKLKFKLDDKVAPHI